MTFFPTTPFVRRPRIAALAIATFAVLVAQSFPAPAKLGAQALNGAPDPLLLEVDRLRNFTEFDISCEISILTVKANKDKSLLKGRYFRRDKEGKFTLILSEPEHQKGEGYLQIDDNLWFYDPETRAFAHSSLKENFQDSKARNDDFTSTSYAADYAVSGRSEGKLGKFDVHVLELDAKNDRIPYAKQKLWVRKDVALVLKQECYARSGKLLVTYVFPSYSEIKGTYVPTRIFLADELVKGESTEINLTRIGVGKIDDRYFTKSFLERSGN